MKPLYFVSTLITLTLSSITYASELNVPNTFSSGDPALASEVNENFTSISTAVNDNFSRIEALEAAVSALTTSVNELESTSPGIVGFNTYYGTDLVFLRDDGLFIIPYTAEEGQQSVPTADDAVVLDTAFEYNALPGLSTVSFEVAEDNTLVLFNSKGRAYNTDFSTKSLLEISLEINGTIPEIGATERLSIIGDDNLSGDSQNWNIFYTLQLDAGTHNFSVMVKGDEQSQDTIGIDGRSIAGFSGAVKVDVIQIKMPN